MRRARAVGIVLPDCDVARAAALRADIVKVRCWLAGFAAARREGGTLAVPIAGEDGLRMLQLLLDDAIKAAP